jgi:AmmeMemoRadiSam system protein A
MLDEERRRTLLDIARRSVASAAAGAAPPSEPAAAGVPDAFGVFVTIKRRGELRGCIGTFECERPLAEEVARTAADSAVRDPRFPPVTPDELPDLSLEISILSPLEPIDPRDDQVVVIGRHGLVVEHGHRRGLLLPQVAVEWGWTPEQFLRQTCRKARLPEDTWQQGAAVYRFEAEVFGE